jgi:hypothetical protein
VTPGQLEVGPSDLLRRGTRLNTQHLVRGHCAAALIDS